MRPNKLNLRKFFLSLLFAVGGLALVGAAAVFLFFKALDREFDVAAPAASFPPPTTIEEARAQDVQHLAYFLELERSWTPESRARAEELYSQLTDAAPTMSDAAFDLAVAEVVAAADNGHTKIREYDRLERYSRLPIRGHFFSNGYYVIRAYEGYEDLIGARIERIGNVSADEAFAVAQHYIGGALGNEQKYAPYILEAPELLHAAGISPAPDRVTITFTMRDGRQRDVEFAGPFPPSTDQAIRSVQLLSPLPFSQSQPNWSAALRGQADVPLYLRHVVDQFALEALPEINGVYLQYWTNSGSTEMDQFHRNARAMIQEREPSVIVLDLRFDLGGNFMTNAGFIDWLGEALPEDGRLYVLIGGTTFSAGIHSAARAVQASGGRAILVGEPVGDGMQFWSEDNLLVLPNSGIQIKFSTGYHDLTEACVWFTDCFWIDMFYPLAVSDLEPDIFVPLTSTDYFAGRDPVLERVLALESEQAS